MSDETPHLKLPFLAESQQNKDVTVNDALNRLDALVQIGVKDRGLATPPASPAEGDRYIVAAGGTGVWSGCDGQLAAFFDGAWTCFAPDEGWTAWIADEHLLLVYRDGAWSDWGSALGALQNLGMLGVGTTADAANPFAAKLNAALWTALPSGEGGSGDLRYTFNKEAAANTASMLFQDGYSGRAEIGLTGDDDFHVKVSADGSSWSEALVLSRASGAATFAKGVAGGLVLPQTKRLLDAMATAPSVRRQRLLDELVGELIYAGIWTKFDGLWVMAAHTPQAALLNLVSPGTGDLTAVNAPAFATDRGFTGDGAAAYLTAGIGFNAIGGFAQDDAHFGAWMLTGMDSSANTVMGAVGDVVNFLQPLAGGSMNSRLNTHTTGSIGVDNGVGHVLLTRNSSSTYDAYKNIVHLGSVAAVSTAPTSASIALLRGASSGYSPSQMAAAHVGASLSAAEIAALYGALHTYLLAVGAVAS